MGRASPLKCFEADAPLTILKACTDERLCPKLWRREDNRIAEERSFTDTLAIHMKSSRALVWPAQALPLVAGSGLFSFRVLSVDKATHLLMTDSLLCPSFPHPENETGVS